MSIKFLSNFTKNFCSGVCGLELNSSRYLSAFPQQKTPDPIQSYPIKSVDIISSKTADNYFTQKIVQRILSQNSFPSIAAASQYSDSATSPTPSLLLGGCFLFPFTQGNQDEDIKTPLSPDYYNEFLPGSDQKSRLQEDLKNRRGLLDISGLTSEELENLANWLENHYHSFIDLKQNACETNPTAFTKIQVALKKNKDCFQDRASPYECALFATLAYENDVKEIKRTLPKGWSLLFEPEKPLPNGYAGMAFVNHQTGQVVVAHRGTDTGSVTELWKDLRSDFDEVACQKIGPQQESAVEFCKKVHDKIGGYNYRIGCVGHSLGGWLAQIGAADLKHQENRQDSYAVCLDSPGAKEVLENYYQDRYGTQEVTPLDTVNYMLLPNLVNTSGTHSGTLYQIYSAEFVKNYRRCKSYLLETHSKANILAGFSKNPQNEPPKMVVVHEWPQVPWNTWIDPNKVTETQGVLEVYDFRSAPIKYLLGLYSKMGQYSKVREEVTTFFDAVDSWKDSALRESEDAFRVRYKARYKTKLYNPQEISLVNVSDSMRTFFTHIYNLKKQSGERPLRLFLKEVAKKEGIPAEDLSFLSSIEIEGKSCSFPNHPKTALELRKGVARVFASYPDITKSLGFPDYLVFLAREYPRLNMQEQFVAILPDKPTDLISRANATEALIQSFEKHNVVYLCGNPGSGKTEVARQYAENFKNGKKTSFIAFLDASDLKTLRREWNQMAVSRLKIECDFKNYPSEQELIDKTCEKLNGEKNYLLVFRGARDSESIEDFLKDQDLNGQILVTTSASAREDQKTDLSLAHYPLDESEVKEKFKGTALEGELKKNQELLSALCSSPSLALLSSQFFKNLAPDEQGTILQELTSGEFSSSEWAKKILEIVERRNVAIPTVLTQVAFFNKEPIKTELLKKWLLSGEFELLDRGSLEEKEVEDQDVGDQETEDAVGILKDFGVLEEPSGGVVRLNATVLAEIKNSIPITPEPLKLDESEVKEKFKGTALEDALSKNQELLSELCSSPSLALLSSHFFKNLAPDEQDKLLQELTSSKFSSSEWVKKMLEIVEGRNAAIPMILTQVAVFDGESIKTELLKEWLLSRKLELLNRSLKEKVIDSAVGILKDFGVLEEAPNEMVRLNAAVPVEPKNSIPITPELLQFLVTQTKMSNLSYEDYKNNLAFSHYISRFLPEEIENEHLVKVLKLINIVANNNLQQELFVSAMELWKIVIVECEKITIPDGRDPKELTNEEKCHNLYKQDRRLPNEYAKALHYFGKILYQANKIEESKTYFSDALEIKKYALLLETKERDVDQVIFQRQGWGWVLLNSDDPSDLHAAKKLYLKLYNDENHPFNHYYCSLQLARAYKKLAESSTDPLTKEHYYTKASQRLLLGGKEEGVAFNGALSVARGNNYKDAEPEILLELGAILGDRDNPNHHFLEAEKYLLRVLELEQKPFEANRKIKIDVLFRTYYQLAMLYKNQREDHPLTSPIRQVENEEALAKAKGCALQGFSILSKASYESLLMLRTKREKEINELQKLL